MPPHLQHATHADKMHAESTVVQAQTGPHVAVGGVHRHRRRVSRSMRSGHVHLGGSKLHLLRTLGQHVLWVDRTFAGNVRSAVDVLRSTSWVTTAAVATDSSLSCKAQPCACHTRRAGRQPSIQS